MTQDLKTKYPDLQWKTLKSRSEKAALFKEIVQAVRAQVGESRWTVSNSGLITLPAYHSSQEVDRLQILMNESYFEREGARRISEDQAIVQTFRAKEVQVIDAITQVRINNTLIEFVRVNENSLPYSRIFYGYDGLVIRLLNFFLKDFGFYLDKQGLHLQIHNNTFFLTLSLPHITRLVSMPSAVGSWEALVNGAEKEHIFNLFAYCRLLGLDTVNIDCKAGVYTILDENAQGHLQKFPEVLELQKYLLKTHSQTIPFVRSTQVVCKTLEEYVVSMSPSSLRKDINAVVRRVSLQEYLEKKLNSEVIAEAFNFNSEKAQNFLKEYFSHGPLLTNLETLVKADPSRILPEVSQFLPKFESLWQERELLQKKLLAVTQAVKSRNEVIEERKRQAEQALRQSEIDKLLRSSTPMNSLTKIENMPPLPKPTVLKPKVVESKPVSELPRLKEITPPREIPREN